MWNKKLSNKIASVFCDDRIVGVALKTKIRTYLIIYECLPCDKQNDDNIDEYRQSLAVLENCIDEQNVNNIIISDDFNAIYCKGRFWEEILNLIDNKSLCVIDEALPDETFTYLYPCNNSKSSISFG